MDRVFDRHCRSCVLFYVMQCLPASLHWLMMADLAEDFALPCIPRFASPCFGAPALNLTLN